MKQLVLDLIPPPHPTFDNFVPGRNAEALCSLMDNGSKSNTGAAFGLVPPDGVAKNSNQIFYLWGESGSGKTHLLSALENVAGAFFLSARQLEAELEAGTPSAPGYVFDDAQTLNDAQQIGLFNLINFVQASNNTPNKMPGRMARVIVAGNTAPRDLPLRPELTSRLGSGLVFQLHPLSDTEKAVALRAHAKARSFTLRDEVIAYLLRHARRDMASLIAMLDALDAHSLETGREITLPLLRQLLQPAPQPVMQSGSQSTLQAAPLQST